ncbi:TonB-dependent receptor domain-containing protein [Candidatus Neomarinimicrobiota bacterium]
MNFNHIFRSILFNIIIVSLSIGQTYTISGRVVENTRNAALPNANVTLLPLESGTVTDRNGNFVLQDLEVGEYKVAVSVIGYKKDTIEVSLLSENMDDLIFPLELEILMLDEVNIVGMLSTRLASETVNSYDGKKIEAENKESLSEILLDIPGIDVQMAHQFGRNVNVSIRGSSDYKPGGYNNRVLVLIDGFPIQIPNSGAPDWNAIPMESVKRIDVVHGPASSLYGHNSMGGVINIITEKPGESKNIKTNIAAGNYDTYRAGVKSGFSVHKLSVQSSINYLSSDGFRFNSDYQNTRGLFKLNYNSDSGKEITFIGIGTHSLTGHPGFIRRDHPEIVSFRRSKRISEYFQAHFYTPITAGITLSTSGSLNRFTTDYFDRDDTPNEKLGVDTKYKDLSATVRSELLITSSVKWLILAGAEFSFDNSNVSVLNPIYENPEQFTSATFIQTKYALGSGWSIGNGLRLDYRTVDPGGGFAKRDFFDFSPKFNLVYNREGQRTFHLSINKGFRAPSISELYLLYESNYGLFFQGTPTLKPEEVWAVELGYEHPHSKRTFWGINLFYNQYRDMIDFVYAIPVKAINREGVYGYGAEFEWYLESYWGLAFSGNYAYLQMNDFNESEPVLYRPEHKMKINLELKGNRQSLGVSGRYTSKQRYEDFLGKWEASGSYVQFPLKWLPATFVVDAILKQSIGSIEINLKIQNIFNREYQIIQDFPMPGRTWLISLTSIINSN